jgi:hypothetical protein
MHNMVDSKLQNASTVSITTDGWSNIRQQRFISITAHFIDDEWNLQKYVLEVAKVSEEHSGENIYNFLKVHLNHHLPKNCLISSVTSDNGKNFMSASHKLVGNDSVSYLAHTIQLCINDVIQNGQWAEDIECVQQIVTKVRMSPKLSEDFYQRQSGKSKYLLSLLFSVTSLESHFDNFVDNTGLMLVQSCPTRWNSEYLMVHRFLKVSEYLYEMEKDNLFGDIVTFPDNDRLARLQG